MNGVFRSVIVKQIFKGGCTRPISVGVSNNTSWNPVKDARNHALGKSMFELLAVDTLTEEYPNLSVAHVNDLAQGLTCSQNLTIQPNNFGNDINDAKDLFIKLGSMQLKNEIENVSSILDSIKEQCLSAISSHDITKLIVSQHPKALLRMVTKDLNDELFLKSYKLSHGIFEAKIFLNGEKKFIEESSSLAEAERLVSLRLLNDNYCSHVEYLKVDKIHFQLEEEIIFGADSYKQRVIELVKSPEESFGFTIRGGEEKVVRNKEYIQLHTITPVFISSIEKNSPAEKYGLRVGDVIVAVNDHSLKNITHKQAVNSLKKFTESEEVRFVVSFEKKELLKFEAEKNLVARESLKLKEELSDDAMGKWHHAKAKLNPGEYLSGKIQHKKRPFVAKQARKSIRLWDLKK